VSSPHTDSGARSSGSGSGGSSILGDTSTADSIVSSAKGQRDDFLMGDDRAIPSPPNWASQSSHELYNGATSNNEPGTADELGAAWTHQGEDLLTAADALYEAITELSGAWVGQASGAAQGSLIGVANASSTAGDAAKAMGKRMHDQASAAAEVKKMPPPKDFNMDQWLAAGLAGGPAAMVADAKAQRDAADAVQAEQQRYMDAYTKAMTDVDGSTPSFGPESIGLKPVAGSSYGSGGSGSAVSGTAVGADGPGVSGIGHSVGSLAGGVNVGLGNLGGGSGGPGVNVPGNLGEVSHASLQQPLSASGVGQVSEAAGGPGAAAALGTAALGAGLGFAGAKAMGGRGGERKQEKPAETEEPQATEVDEAGEGVGELPETPEVREVSAAAPGAAGHSVQAPTMSAPQFGQPLSGQPGPQGAPINMPVAPEFSAPSQPQVPMSQPAPLTEGATSGAADPAAAAQQGATQSVAAGAEQQHGPAAGGQQPQTFQQQQAAAAQAMGPGPMQPMGGGGGMAGAGAAGGVGGVPGQTDHDSASYLIQPDPDDVFGPTEAVTSGVIGEDPEDD
jgi:hypothetical protein